MQAEHIEALARAGHRHYARARRSPADEWENLDDVEREANLDSARFAPLLLAALGLEIVGGDHPGRRRSLTEEEVEAGSRLEHLRWCRFTRRAGRGEHVDAVPWGDLDEAARELDRIRVRPLPRLLADLGYSVVDRDEPHPTGSPDTVGTEESS